MQIRHILRDIALPLFRPVWHRLWGRIEARLAPISTKTAALEAAWEQYGPAIRNAAASVGAFGTELQRQRREHVERSAQVDRSLVELRHQLATFEARLDAITIASRPGAGPFRERLGGLDAASRAQHISDAADRFRVRQKTAAVRRALRVDVPRGRGQTCHGPTAPVESAAKPEISVVLSDCQLALPTSSGPIRLHLGCGEIALGGYVNVDRRDLPGVDVIADAGSLPFDPGTVAEIASGRLLEHLPQEALRRDLLPYWRDLLVPGGLFRAKVSDGAAMIAELVAGAYSFDDFRDALFAVGDGDPRADLFTPDSLRRLLEEAGFHDVDVPIAGRHNGTCFEFEIVARR